MLKKEINKVLGNKIEGIYLFKADEDDEQFIEDYQKGIIKKISLKSNMLLILDMKSKDNSKELSVEVIKVEECLNDYFDKIKAFVEDSFTIELDFPKDFNYITKKYPKIGNRINEIRGIMIPMINRTQYKGYKTNVKIREDNSFIIEKNFVVKYNALIFSRSNIPYVKLTTYSEENSCIYYNRRDVVFLDSKTMIMKYSNFDKFLEYNKIEENDILVNKNSINEFYGFDNVLFVKPTKNWVKKWWNYDCPELHKYLTNKNYTKNNWGLCLNCWRSDLVHSSWNAVYIDEDITEKEVELFAGDYKHTSIYKQMNNVLKARNYSKDEKECKINEVNEFENRVQKIVCDNSKKILFDVCDHFKCVPFIKEQNKQKPLKNCTLKELSKLLSKLDGKMGMDCGFLYIAPTGETLKLFKEVSEFDEERYKTGSMKISCPWEGQSTTIQEVIGQAIVKYVKEQGIEIHSWTVLD